MIVVRRDRDTVDMNPDGTPDLVPTLVPPASVVKRTVQGKSGWTYLVDVDGDEFWWYTALDGADFGVPTEVVGLVFAITPGAYDKLTLFAALSNRAWTLRELRADGGAAATAIKAAWKMQRRDDMDVVTEPVAMLATIAGFDYQAAAELYADVTELP